jgi:hypothetical protein
MTTTPELRVRLLLREALERIDDARCTATDAWTATRLQIIERDLEDTLTLLAPNHIGLPGADAQPAQFRRR